MARKEPYRLTDAEIEILQKGVYEPDYITDYFLRPEGRDQGWKFDYNFDPEGAWQRDVHTASQKRILVIGGFGSGKTRGIGASACVWSTCTLDFKFMNCAPHSWQTELMYRFIINELTPGTPFEKLIWRKPMRPYPQIELKFYVGELLVYSTLEFMSVDENASAILSWEGDWVNIDEAGKLDDLEGTLTNLGSRLRGSINGRARLGRMSMVSNSWDNPQMWTRYDMAVTQPESFLSITVSSRHNHNITDEQLRFMLLDIPEDEHERFIEGARPEGRGKYFSKPKVYACEDEFYGNFIIDRIQAQAEGYAIETLHGAGVVYVHTPAAASHAYMVLGDPGISNAPARNSPCIQVWDVTDFPKKKANMVAFWWGSGFGSITPFINRLLHFMEDYDPIFTGVDATGPQKNTNELLNLVLTSERTDDDKMQEWLGTADRKKITNINIQGLDFSTGKKAAYLIAGRMFIEANLMIWPKFITGMRSQLTNYDPEKDRIHNPKIAQDLVATYCMAAHSIRAWFAFDPEEYRKQQADEPSEPYYPETDRSQRLPGDERIGARTQLESSREKSRPLGEVNYS
jgi:hypothetical protein